MFASAIAGAFCSTQVRLYVVEVALDRVTAHRSIMTTGCDTRSVPADPAIRAAQRAEEPLD
jgi:hypothetical protein